MTAAVISPIGEVSDPPMHGLSTSLAYRLCEHFKPLTTLIYLNIRKPLTGLIRLIGGDAYPPALPAFGIASRNGMARKIPVHTAGSAQIPVIGWRCARQGNAMRSTGGRERIRNPPPFGTPCRCSPLGGWE